MIKSTDIVDFYPQTFSEIDKQDNPAFGKDECLMIVRASERSTKNNPDRATVLLILPHREESVNRLAVFWKHEQALNYCKMLCEKEETNNEY